LEKKNTDSPLLCTNPLGEPHYKTRLCVESGEIEGRAAVVVTGRKVGSVFNEQFQRLRAGVPFGSEMGGGAECSICRI
jgi:hypothetical protein